MAPYIGDSFWLYEIDYYYYFNRMLIISVVSSNRVVELIILPHFVCALSAEMAGQNLNHKKRYFS